MKLGNGFSSEKLQPIATGTVAMSYLKLGNLEEAKKYSKLFDAAMRLDRFKDNEENKSFAREVEKAFTEIEGASADDN